MTLYTRSFRPDIPLVTDIKPRRAVHTEDNEGVLNNGREFLSSFKGVAQNFS